eukprot:g15743.t1
MSSVKKYTAVERALAIGRKKYGVQKRRHVVTSEHDEGDIQSVKSKYRSRERRNDTLRERTKRDGVNSYRKADGAFAGLGNVDGSKLNIIDENTINFIFSDSYNSHTPSKRSMADRKYCKKSMSQNYDEALFENFASTKATLPTFEDIDTKIDDLFADNANFLQENFDKSRSVFADAGIAYTSAVNDIKGGLSNDYKYGKFTVGRMNNSKSSIAKDTSLDILPGAELGLPFDEKYDDAIDYKLKLETLVDSLSREVEVLKNSRGSFSPLLASPRSSRPTGTQKKTVNELYETSTGLVINVPVEVPAENEENEKQVESVVLNIMENPPLLPQTGPTGMPPQPPMILNERFHGVKIQQWFDKPVRHYRSQLCRKCFNGFRANYNVRKRIFYQMNNNILSRPCRKWEGVGITFQPAILSAERGRDVMAKEYFKQRLLKVCFAKLLLNVHEDYEDFVINVLPPPLVDTPLATPKSRRQGYDDGLKHL